MGYPVTCHIPPARKLLPWRYTEPQAFSATVWYLTFFTLLIKKLVLTVAERLLRKDWQRGKQNDCEQAGTGRG